MKKEEDIMGIDTNDVNTATTSTTTSSTSTSTTTTARTHNTNNNNTCDGSIILQTVANRIQVYGELLYVLITLN